MRESIKFGVLMATMILTLILPGCGGGDDPTVPLTPDPVGATGYTLAPATTVIPVVNRQDILGFDPATGTLTVAESSVYAGQLQAGDIIIGQNETTAPSGFLRRVTNKALTGGDAVLQTQPAPLTEAFQTLAISDSLQLRRSQITDSTLLNGTTLTPGVADEVFSLNLDLVFHDADGDTGTPGDRIRVSGTYAFTGRLFTDIRLANSQVTTFRTSLATERSADLTLQAGTRRTFPAELDLVLAEFTLAPLSYLDVLWLSPTVTVTAHIDGDLGVTFESDLSYSETARIGFAQEAGDLFLVRDNTLDFTFVPPEFSEELAFETGVALDTHCQLYGAAGPRFDTGTTLYFQAAFNPDPCLDVLDFGLQATAEAGVDLDHTAVPVDFSRTFQLYDHSVGDWVFPLSGWGTLTLDPNPDEIQASWWVTGPCDFSQQGAGDGTLSQLMPGRYEVCWLYVVGYEEPLCESVDVPEDGTVGVTGLYQEESGPGGGYVSIPPRHHAVPVTYLMGGKEADDETPHEVTLTRRFEMSENEISNGQFIEILQWALDQGHVTVADTVVVDALDGSTEVLVNLDNQFGELAFADGVFYTLLPERPVQLATWYGAVAYCDWLSLRAGLARAYNHASWTCNGGDPYAAAGFRLPTEAEWEFACRAGTTSHFYTGGCLNSLTQANYNGWEPMGNCLDGPYPGGLVEIGRYPANDWGLYDMHGNIWEWCNDWYADYEGLALDPTGPATGTLRVLRSGYWNYSGMDCRSAARDHADPSLEYDDTGGIRPVRTLN